MCACSVFKLAVEFLFLQAKDNLMGQPSPEAKNLHLTCSLNLMSCYLKTNQFSEAVAEGDAVSASGSFASSCLSCVILQYSHLVNCTFSRSHCWRSINNYWSSNMCVIWHVGSEDPSRQPQGSLPQGPSIQRIGFTEGDY